MKKTELLDLKELLEKQLKDLQSDLARNLAQPMSTPALADINDQASFETERSFEIRIKDRERKLIGKVQEALKKISDGTYGICVSCGESIGVKRLQARPVTDLCINCKSEMEAEERRVESFEKSAAQGSAPSSSPLN
jgi:DnaK suppressor protein